MTFKTIFWLPLFLFVLGSGCSSDEESTSEKEEKVTLQEEETSSTPSKSTPSKEVEDLKKENPEFSKSFSYETGFEGDCRYISSNVFNSQMASLMSTVRGMDQLIMNYLALILLGDEEDRKYLKSMIIGLVLSASRIGSKGLKKIQDMGAWEGNYIQASLAGHVYFLSGNKFDQVVNCHKNFPQWIKDNADLLEIGPEQIRRMESANSVDEFVENTLRTADKRPVPEPQIKYKGKKGAHCNFECSEKEFCKEACLEFVDEYNCLLTPLSQYRCSPKGSYFSKGFCEHQAIPCSVRTGEEAVDVFKERVEFFNSLGQNYTIMTEEEVDRRVEEKRQAQQQKGLSGGR